MTIFYQTLVGERKINKEKIKINKKTEKKRKNKLSPIFVGLEDIFDDEKERERE